MIKSPEQKPESPQHFGNIEELEFQNVKFKHQSANQAALGNISFTVKTGENVVLLGDNNAEYAKLVFF